MQDNIRTPPSAKPKVTSKKPRNYTSGVVGAEVAFLGFWASEATTGDFWLGVSLAFDVCPSLVAC